MSNITIIICLLIIATASEALNLASLKPEYIAQGSLLRKIALTEKEIADAHKDAKKQVAAAVSAVISHIDVEPQAGPSRQEHPIIHEHPMPNDQQSQCSEILVALREDAFNRLDKILESAHQYLEHAKNESLACQTTPPMIFSGVRAIRRMLEIKRTFPGVVAKAKSDFVDVVDDVKKKAKKESQNVRRCEEASTMAMLDWSHPSPAPQESDDLLSLSSLEDNEKPSNQ